MCPTCTREYVPPLNIARILQMTDREFDREFIGKDIWIYKSDARLFLLSTLRKILKELQGGAKWHHLKCPIRKGKGDKCDCRGKYE